jgi:hypothetical protein
MAWGPSQLGSAQSGSRGGGEARALVGRRNRTFASGGKRSAADALIQRTWLLSIATKTQPTPPNRLLGCPRLGPGVPENPRVGGSIPPLATIQIKA